MKTLNDFNPGDFVSGVVDGERVQGVVVFDHTTRRRLYVPAADGPGHWRVADDVRPLVVHEQGTHACIDPEDTPQVGRVAQVFIEATSGTTEGVLAKALRAERDRQHQPEPRYFVRELKHGGWAVCDRAGVDPVALSVWMSGNPARAEQIARDEAAYLNGGEG